MRFIDAFLNTITMYRLTMMGLLSLAVISIACAFFQTLPYTALDLTISLIVLLVATRLSNMLFALFAKAAPTPESSLITGLILFFILTPLQSIHDGLVLALIACIAMLSKYVLVFRRKHIFNPAAVGALFASVTGIGVASWWIGTPILLPFVLVLGFLIARKTRRLDLTIAFFVVATGTFAVRLLVSHISYVAGFTQFVFSWPLFFFAGIMLTEPQTTPPYKNDRLIYGTLVGLLFSLAFKVGPVSATPEFALLMGNIFSFVVGFKRRVTLTFKEALPLTRDIYEFVFLPKQSFRFESGQYAEWTLLHRRVDTRGVRRFFTIASSPHDPFVRLGMRVPVEGSSFKATMRELTKGAVISMTGVAGEFTLPEKKDEKIAAIAGGIGITPFMSMFRHLAERREHRDMVLIYAANSPLDFAYQKEIDALADSIGLTVIYLPTDFTEMTDWNGRSGYVTDLLIRDEIRDYKNRTWYLSGPDAMVRNYKGLLKGMGLSGLAIKTDYFPGL